MIKRIISIVSMFIIGSAFVWAVWEGNASSGTAAEFPSGLFAYSDVFPKHTLIEVVNLENNARSRAMIVNNTGSEGFLLRVSPELAKALGIEYGTTVRIRVSTPPHVAENGADPIVLGKKVIEPVQRSQPPELPVTDTMKSEPLAKHVVENTQPVQIEPPPVPPAEVKEPQKPAKKQNPVPAPVANAALPKKPVEAGIPHPSPVAEIGTPVQSTPADEPVIVPITEITAPIKPDSAAEPSPAPVSEAAEPVKPVPAEEPAVEPIDEIDTPIQPEAAIEPVPVSIFEIGEPVRPAFAEKLDPEPVVEITVPVQPEAEEEQHFAVKEVAVIHEKHDPVPEVQTPIMPESKVEDVPVIVAFARDIQKPPVSEEEPASTVREVSQITKPEIPLPVTEEAAAEPAPLETLEPEDSVSEAEQSEEQALPSQPEPLSQQEPSQEETAKTAPVPELKPVPEDRYLTLIPTGPKEPVGQKPELPAAKPSVQPVSPKAEPVEKESQTETLTKGAFYVQVGRFKDSANADSFVKKYGNRYPVTVEKSSGENSVSYKVYIGPLKKDERGAALETFKKLGFKDAFLKQVQ